MNLNMNPKVLHALMEVTQILGIVSTVAGVAGHFYPVAIPLGIGAAAAATAIKAYSVGNIPPNTPQS